MKILIVDDEQDIKTLFEQRFRKELRAGDLQFLFAYSGEEAMEVLTDVSAADVILILSDINMPGLSGLELLKMVKERLPHLKVMMITAYGDPETRARAEGLGADSFLTKPIDFVALKNAMDLLKKNSGEQS
jgi:two-component system, chemotaxis family, chemotaxis protein CheY